jgi:hypothetical protein
MKNVNWGRFVLGALIVAALCFISDGFLHQRVINDQWHVLIDTLGVSIREHGCWAALYFAIFELGRGLLTLFVHVLLRPRIGAGPLTAVWAGVTVWFAYSLTGPVQFIPIGFFSAELWLGAAAYQLVASIIAAIAGASVYRE